MNTETKKKRKLVLFKVMTKEDSDTEVFMSPLEMCEKFLVGSHVPMKSSELTKCLSVYAATDVKKPYQVFLGSPQMSRMNICSSQIE